ncbi:MAG: nicotinate-nucleotide--dimethylbenzimidazole phosphoribosyltransferase [Candidatus Limnocylindrales bacterium]|nr:nicotinate-nucleotide--dimethylbenzimidazole phosphoribosyltransferase [Candidatus Limnocylindrales bacterium]
MNAAAEDAGALAAVIDQIGPLDGAAMAAAAGRLDRLTKPPGSLGRLEELVITLAGITGRPDAPLAHRQIVVAAGDHGVVRQNVSAYPSEVTPQMVSNFVAGGAAINVLAAAAGASVTVVDVGVALPIPRVRRDRRRGGRLVRARIRNGTADMTQGPAMSRGDALHAVNVGLRLVTDLRLRGGIDVLGVGEMGIGNTTAASAIVAALTGEPVHRVTGRGTGVDDEALARKVAAIEEALAVNRPDRADPIGVLAAVGGFEIATLVGLILGAAAARIPVVLDGFITGAAALVGAALQPALAPRLIAAHRSPEPGHAIVLERLGLRPYLDLSMRLGEGSGAALLIGLLATACQVRDEMATFESAAISGPSGG